MNNFPRLLIICHNLYDNSNNIGKTLVSLLDGWPKDRIAQLYFRKDPPSFDVCDRYYCITDMRVLKSALSLRILSAGDEVRNHRAEESTKAENTFYRIGNDRKPAVSFIRDLIWRVARWKTKRLRKWIKDFSPDIILFAPNDYCLAYRVALYVERIVRKPVIPFYMDDAFYLDCRAGLVDSYRRKSLRKLAKKVNNYCDRIFTICDEMSDVYMPYFNRRCKAFLNSVRFDSEVPQARRTDPCQEFVISYLGNLHSNRWKSVLDVAECAEELNAENGWNIVVRIYSGSLLGGSLLDEFREKKCIDFRGKIPSSEVRAKQLESDLLLFIESFDKKSIYSTKLSLSTKIPEYMSVKRCIFAYGPMNVASMKYLQKNGVAQVCSDSAELKAQLCQLIRSEELRNTYSEKGYELAKSQHDIAKNSVIFKQEIKEAFAIDRGEEDEDRSD